MAIYRVYSYLKQERKRQLTCFLENVHNYYNYQFIAFFLSRRRENKKLSAVSNAHVKDNVKKILRQTNGVEPWFNDTFL